MNNNSIWTFIEDFSHHHIMFPNLSNFNFAETGKSEISTKAHTSIFGISKHLCIAIER